MCCRECERAVGTLAPDARERIDRADRASTVITSAVFCSRTLAHFLICQHFAQFLPLSGLDVAIFGPGNFQSKGNGQADKWTDEGTIEEREEKRREEKRRE